MPVESAVLPSGQSAKKATPWGVWSECGALRSVLLHRPGSEIESVTDARAALWNEPLDPLRAREQHDRLAAIYRSHGVAVHYAGQAEGLRPNLYFMRDTFSMTPRGAILSHPATASRAGEEKVAGAALRELGVPVILSLDGGATFEGADLMIVNAGLALIGCGGRTNPAGAARVGALLAGSGIGEVVPVRLTPDCLHLDCALNVVSRRLALAHPDRLPADCSRALRRHGFEILPAPSREEAGEGMSINLVALEPGVVLMPAGRPATRRILEQAGVVCLEVEVGELMKGAGGIHCMTGIIHRSPI